MMRQLEDGFAKVIRWNGVREYAVYYSVYNGQMFKTTEAEFAKAKKMGLNCYTAREAYGRNREILGFVKVSDD